MSNREFKTQTAVRDRVPLLIGLTGPSGGGKTFSALRLATGIKTVVGGKIYVIDTEARRALHYADQFEFEHLDFAPPFASGDYLAAIRYCVGQGAKVVVIDSTSHEHDGPGGYLETHEKEIDRLSRGDPEKRERVNFLAWSKPAEERRKMVSGLLQLACNFIFTFRAKEKIKLIGGKMQEQGWMPICGDSLFYEMTLNCMLLPKADGTPIWQSEYIGERQAMKLPLQFRELFKNKPQLTEEVGRELATWAAAGSIGHQARTQQLAEGEAIKILEETKPDPELEPADTAPPQNQRTSGTSQDISGQYRAQAAGPPIPAGLEELDRMLQGAAGVSWAALKTCWERLAVPQQKALKKRLEEVHKPRARAIKQKMSLLGA